jgi:hypothetical protein
MTLPDTTLAGQFVVASVSCGPTDVLLSGGYFLSAAAPGNLRNIMVTHNRPTFAGPGGQWQVTVMATANFLAGNSVTVTPQVVCTP